MSTDQKKEQQEQIGRFIREKEEFFLRNPKVLEDLCYLVNIKFGLNFIEGARAEALNPQILAYKQGVRDVVSEFQRLLAVSASKNKQVIT